MTKAFFCCCVISSVALIACSPVLNHLPGVYSLDIQQGNIIDQAMIDQLRPGMSKRQVLYIMGSPMLVDALHQSRWDYLYTEKSPDGEKTRKRITLLFNKDDLIGLQGDLKPNAVPVVKTGETTVEIPKRDLEKTLWEKITGLFNYDASDDVPTKKATTDASSGNIANSPY